MIWMVFNSTQRASMDAGVKTPHVHIYLVTIAYRYYNQLISRTDLITQALSLLLIGRVSGELTTDAVGERQQTYSCC